MSATAYERVIVDPPPGTNLGKVRARTPSQVAEMRRLRDAGVSVHAIAHAYGLHKRTVYRYLDEDTLFDVEIGSWTAVFAIRGTTEPVRVTPWERMP